MRRLTRSDIRKFSTAFYLSLSHLRSGRTYPFTLTPGFLKTMYRPKLRRFYFTEKKKKRNYCEFTNTSRATLCKKVRLHRCNVDFEHVPWSDVAASIVAPVCFYGNLQLVNCRKLPTCSNPLVWTLRAWSSRLLASLDCNGESKTTDLNKLLAIAVSMQPRLFMFFSKCLTSHNIAVLL